MGEIVIRDVSRPPTKEWIPPIGAMGGPPAHELYRELVQRAGLRLFRDHRGNPYVALRDGEHRRTFRVPSIELREALDRFRMNRNLRPVPEQELRDFARVVDARVSDPDIFVPTVEVGGTPARPISVAVPERSEPLDPKNALPPGWEEEISSIARDEEEDPVRPEAFPQEPVKAPSAWTDVVESPTSPPPEEIPLSLSISGGCPPPRSEEGLPRYLSAFRSLIAAGDWVGTTAELSHLTGDTPERVFARLRAYRSDLAGSGIVVVPIETRLGWRWLAVDESHIRLGR